MYFNQKAINNVQSHYQTNIMELTLLPHLILLTYFALILQLILLNLNK